MIPHVDQLTEQKKPSLIEKQWWEDKWHAFSEQVMNQTFISNCIHLKFEHSLFF